MYLSALFAVGVEAANNVVRTFQWTFQGNVSDQFFQVFSELIRAMLYSLSDRVFRNANLCH